MGSCRIMSTCQWYCVAIRSHAQGVRSRKRGTGSARPGCGDASRAPAASLLPQLVIPSNPRQRGISAPLSFRGAPATRNLCFFAGDRFLTPLRFVRNDSGVAALRSTWQRRGRRARRGTLGPIRPSPAPSPPASLPAGDGSATAAFTDLHEPGRDEASPGKTGLARPGSCRRCLAPPRATDRPLLTIRPRHSILCLPAGRAGGGQR